MILNDPQDCFHTSGVKNTDADKKTSKTENPAHKSCPRSMGSQFYRKWSKSLDISLLLPVKQTQASQLVVWSQNNLTKE